MTSAWLILVIKEKVFASQKGTMWHLLDWCYTVPHCQAGITIPSTYRDRGPDYQTQKKLYCSWRIVCIPIFSLTVLFSSVKHFSGRAFQKGSMWHPDHKGVTHPLSLGHTQVCLNISATTTTQETKSSLWRSQPQTTIIWTEYGLKLPSVEFVFKPVASGH